MRDYNVYCPLKCKAVALGFTSRPMAERFIREELEANTAGAVYWQVRLALPFAPIAESTDARIVMAAVA